jgi:hypothetical protein
MLMPQPAKVQIDQSAGAQVGPERRPLLFNPLNSLRVQLRVDAFSGMAHDVLSSRARIFKQGDRNHA